MTQNKLVFLDLETTGVDAKRDQILEVGLLIVVNNGVFFRKQWQVFHPWMSFYALPSWTPKEVYEMHQASGLLHAIEEQVEKSRELSNPTAAYFADNFYLLHVVEGIVLRELQAAGFQQREAVIAGYTPHFDRRFIEEWMPTLHDFLHYRHMDVSSFRETAKQLGYVVPDQKKAHRALIDCEEAWSEYSMYRRWLQAGATQYGIALAEESA